nr:RNA polymerase sigma-70 factor [Chitinophaga hostae]
MPNEKEVLKKVSQGDSAGFQLIFTHYYDTLFSVALSYIKVSEWAEDIIQQVFLRIWEKRHTLPDIDHFDRYIFILTRNEILSSMRKQIVRQKYKVRVREMFQEEFNTPEQYLIAKQKGETIRKAVGNLSAKQQQAWKLSREKGLSYEEISTEMGISIPTVKSHISNALGAIRKFLADYRYDLYILLIISLLLQQ